MAKINDTYRIVVENSFYELEEKVNAMITKIGFKPQGGVAVVNNGKAIVYYQAMIKE